MELIPLFFALDKEENGCQESNAKENTRRFRTGSFKIDAEVINQCQIRKEKPR